MDLRKSSKFKGLLTKRSSVDSTSTVKTDKEEVPKNKPNKKISKLNITRLDYGDDDALIESGLWSDIKVLLWDFIPDYTPLNFILIQLFAYMLFLSFRAISFPKPVDDLKVEEDVVVQYEHLSYIKDYFDNDEKQYELIMNTIKLVFFLLLINMLFLFIVLSIRFVFMKFLFEPFSRISRRAVLIAYSVDPSFFYFLWSLINYTFFLRCTIEGDAGQNYSIYEFRFLGYYFSKSFWIDSKCYSWSKSMYHLHILFGVRKLLLSSILFLFELQFLANYSTDLTTYLNELSCLRKFTLKWLNFVYSHKSMKSKELDDLMTKFLNTDMSVVKKSYNTIWMEHRKDDFKIFRPILSKWQHHNIKNELDLNDYNGTDFIKDLWLNSMSIKPSVNWIVLNYVIHNPPEIILLHHSIQLICKEIIDHCSKLLFDQIYETLTLLKSKGGTARLVSFVEPPSDPKIERECEVYVEDESNDFYRFEDVGDRAYRLSQLSRVRNVDELHITRDFEPARARKYVRNTSKKVPELMKYRSTIVDPYTPLETCMDVLISNKIQRESSKNEEEEDDRYITRELCCDLDIGVVEDFFASYDISNCGAVSLENFMTTLINMCSIRKKLITTLKNQRSILELVGNLISIILWFMSFVAILLSFRINKNIVLPSTIGLFSATIVALSYMYTSFITAIMFVVISNPYNVGDRVRIGGQVMYVRRITTYNTEFRSSHGKHIIFQNILLSKMLIINESRAKHATLELSIKMGSSTTPVALKMLRDNVKTFVNGRPRDFVTNSIFFHCDKLQIAHYVNLVIWATCVETWSNTRVVFGLRTELMRFVAKQCNLLGIGYENPLSPVYFKNSLSLGGLDNYISNYMYSHPGDDDKYKPKDKKSGFDADVSTTFPRKSDYSTKSGSSEAPQVSMESPMSLRTLFKSSKLEHQKSTGFFNIEPMFPGHRRRTPDSKAPPAPPPETLHHIHKNVHVTFPHPHHVPKMDEDNYENVWLNTWSPDNRPDRFKTLSFELSPENVQVDGSGEGENADAQDGVSGKPSLRIVCSDGFNIESPLRPESKDLGSQVDKELDYLKEGGLKGDEPPRKSRSKSSSGSSVDKTLDTGSEDLKSSAKRKSSSVRSSSERRRSSDDNTDQSVKRKSKSRSSSEHPSSDSRKHRRSKDSDDVPDFDPKSLYEKSRSRSRSKDLERDRTDKSDKNKEEKRKEERVKDRAYPDSDDGKYKPKDKDKKSERDRERDRDRENRHRSSKDLDGKENRDRDKEKVSERKRVEKDKKDGKTSLEKMLEREKERSESREKRDQLSRERDRTDKSDKNKEDKEKSRKKEKEKSRSSK